MRKLALILISILFTVNIAACAPSGVISETGTIEPTPTPEPVINITASEAFTLENAQAIVNYQAVADQVTDNSVLYRSEPVGQGDTVTVKIEQYSDITPKERVRSNYDKVKSMRPSAETISGIGEDAYIAFPTVHVYMNGYHVSVSAGSGADEAQRELLINVGNTVADNINNILNQ